MQECPNCNHVNRPGVLFCEQCGASLRGDASPLSTKTLDKEAQKELAPVLEKKAPPEPTPRGTGQFPKGGALRLEIEGSQEPLHFTFSHREIVLGRRDPATGALPDIDLTPYAGYRMGVSRRHSQIRYGDDGQLAIIDLGSSNHTYLNERVLDAHYPTALHDGDRLRLGQLAMRVSFQPSTDAEQKADEPAKTEPKAEVPAATAPSVAKPAVPVPTALATLQTAIPEPAAATTAEQKPDKPDKSDEPDKPSALKPAQPEQKTAEPAAATASEQVVQARIQNIKEVLSKGQKDASQIIKELVAMGTPEDRARKLVEGLDQVAQVELEVKKAIAQSAEVDQKSTSDKPTSEKPTIEAKTDEKEQTEEKGENPGG